MKHVMTSVVLLGRVEYLLTQNIPNYWERQRSVRVPEETGIKLDGVEK